MGAKQILRVAKLHTLADVAKSARHTFREIPTHNADPSQATKNAHSTRNAAEIGDRVGERLEGLKVRKNAVRVLEFLVTASPEYFKRRSGQTYFDEARRFLEKSFGKENVVSHHVHRDETTPHAVFYVVPVDPKGKLNARHYIGGRVKLQGLQDAFHSQVAKKCGLERGLRGSKAEHTEIKDFYGRAKKKVPPAPTRLGLLTMSEDDRLELVKDLHAQAVNGKAEAEKMEGERARYVAKIENLEKRLSEQNDERELLYKATAKLIKNAYTPADFAQVFGVELKGKADVFDSLIKAGKASDFKEAVALVALKMPSKTGAKWSDLAVEDLNFRRGLDGLEPLKTFEAVMPSAPQSAAAKRPKPR